jgi:putative hemolysin
VITKILILIILLFCAFAFAAAEVAFYALISSKERFYGQSLERIIYSPQIMLSTILVSNAITVFLFTLLSASVAVDIADRFSFDKTATLSVEVMIVSGVLIIFADAVPKMVASRNSKLTAKLAMPLLFLLLLIESPIVYPLNVFLVRLNARRKKSSLTIDNRGLKTLSKIASFSGVIEKNEAQLLEKISFFGEKTVRDAMTKRAEIVSVPDDIKFDQVVEVLKKSGHSRLPVFSGVPDNIVGIFYARDFLPSFRRKSYRRRFNIRHLMRKPVFVPETQSLEKLIETFKTNRVHIAVVVNEFGGLSGVITLSDIVREIFGASAEMPREDMVITKLPDDSFLVKGSARLSEIIGELPEMFPLNESFEAEINSGETVSSLLVHHHGSVPKVGSRIILGDLEFEIEQATPKSILQVKVKFSKADSSVSEKV